MNNTLNSTNSFETAYSVLINFLQEEISLYEELYSVMTKKTKAIVAGDLAELEAILHEEQLLLKNAHEFSEHRQKTVQVLLGNTVQEDVRLKEIISQAPNQFQRPLLILRDELQFAVRGIQQVNTENRYLLNKSIEYVKGLIHLFLTMEEEKPGLYDGDGKLAGDKSNGPVMDFQL